MLWQRYTAAGLHHFRRRIDHRRGLHLHVGAGASSCGAFITVLQQTLQPFIHGGLLFCSGPTCAPAMSGQKRPRLTLKEYGRGFEVMLLGEPS